MCVHEIAENLNIVLEVDEKCLLHRAVGQVSIGILFNFIFIQYDVIEIMLDENPGNFNFHEILQIVFLIFHVFILSICDILYLLWQSLRLYLVFEHLGLMQDFFCQLPQYLGVLLRHQFQLHQLAVPWRQDLQFLFEFEVEFGLELFHLLRIAVDEYDVRR